MITLRPSSERGHTQIGWLDSYHTFSFGGYQDPAHMGYGPLRVINDDRVEPAQGFGTHGHRDMEIITVVLEGALEHKDSLGTGSVIFPGDVQKMSAGKGILHSEYNASHRDPVHFLQVWIIPDTNGVHPEYQQKHFDVAERTNRLRLVASRDGREGSITLLRDADMYVSTLTECARLEVPLRTERKYWLHTASGTLHANGQAMQEGDGLAIEGETALTLSSDSGAQIVLFDLAV
jgi:redox-sensitive bicupin YhaK (pirin superfamily)